MLSASLLIVYIHSTMSASVAPQYAKDELEPPPWLNVQFLRQVLQKDLPNSADLVVTRCDIAPATNRGEHYASVMFRVNVEYTLHEAASGKHNRSMIIKTIPNDASQKQQILQDSMLFETEMDIYTCAIPQLEALLSEAGLATRLGASCLYHAMQPEKVIVFEDLATLQYKIVRGRSLTIAEIQTGYRKLAKWHAASFKLVKEEPQCFTRYCHNFMTMPFITDSDFISGGLVNFIELLSITDTLRQYATFFTSIQPHWTSLCIASYNKYFEQSHPKRGTNFYGLCHGDFLSNNLMFKHYIGRTEDAAEDVLLVDFQLCYLGPLINDLIYAFYMLYNAEQRAQHRDELLAFYFQNFVQTLQRLGYRNDNELNIGQLKAQLKQQKYLDFFLLVNFLPIRYAVKAGHVDKDYMQATIQERRPLYFNPDYIGELHTLLEMYASLGYFD